MTPATPSTEPTMVCTLRSPLPPRAEHEGPGDLPRACIGVSAVDSPQAADLICYEVGGTRAIVLLGISMPTRRRSQVRQELPHGPLHRDRERTSAIVTVVVHGRRKPTSGAFGVDVFEKGFWEIAILVVRGEHRLVPRLQVVFQDVEVEVVVRQVCQLRAVRAVEARPSIGPQDHHTCLRPHNSGALSAETVHVQPMGGSGTRHQIHNRR
mmetsp:Transcript_2503/g.7403  ORF Transcript_2503/g.7403 Transcript_2503/m.7403 type:complete len:210 (+) Transcript_2503:323-952(+)